MGRRCKNKECTKELQPAAKCKDIIEKKGFCSTQCATIVGRAKQNEARLKKERQEHRKAKERVKRPSDLKKEAQKAFNAFIRARDAGLECISCDRPIQEIEGSEGWKVGGAWDCGHYLTVGAHEELRFEELNAHRQCKSCNAGSGKYTNKNKTVGQRYTEKLIERIGKENVDWLNGAHEPKRYRADDFRRIRDEYKAKLKELKPA